MTCGNAGRRLSHPWCTEYRHAPKQPPLPLWRPDSRLVISPSRTARSACELMLGCRGRTAASQTGSDRKEEDALL